jgi:dihydrofolate reductase
VIAATADAPLVTLIAAVARNGVIGDGERLLWRIAEDMQYFRQATRGHPVIMGRTTWLSLPERFRPLPERRNIVLTRDPQFGAPGAETAGSLDAALALTRGAARVFVIGGAQLYALALPQADELLLTEIDRDFDGDSVFPAWNRAEFDEASRSAHDSGQGFGYQRARYRRKKAR